MEPEIELLLYVLVAVAISCGVFYTMAFVVQRVKLLWIEIESNRIDMLAKRASVKMALDESDLKTQVIRPDEAGLLPVSRRMLDSGMTTEAALQIALAYIDAQRTHAPVPHTLSRTYAPHIKQDKFAVVEDEPAQLEQHALVAQNFFELYQSDQLPKDKFLIGFDLEDEQPVIAGWNHLYSALIGGQSGSGKSTLIRNVLAQSALQGGRFAILDPHFASGDESLGASLMPLRKQMLFDVASNDNEMVQAIKYVAEVGKRRLSGKDTDRTPLVLIVDETTALLSRGAIAPDLLGLLEMIAQETRKVGVYAMCIGQQFSAETMKTTARNSFVSMLSCRARRDVARIQSGNIQFAKMAEQLTVGQAVWMAPTGDVRRIAVPNCTQRHLEAIGSVIAGEYTDITQHQGNTPVAPCRELVKTVSVDVSDPDEGDTLRVDFSALATPQAKRAVELFLSGAYTTDILKEAWGVSGGGPKQMKASRELMDIIRLYTLSKGGK